MDHQLNERTLSFDMIHFKLDRHENQPPCLYKDILVHSVSKFKRGSSNEDDESYGIGKCLVEEGIIVLSGSCRKFFTSFSTIHFCNL